MLYNLDLQQELTNGDQTNVVSQTQFKKVTESGMIVVEASRSELERKEDSNQNKISSVHSS